MDKGKAFIIALEKISREYGYKIGGCGCCGSPYIEKLENSESDEASGYGFTYQGGLNWISEADSFDWDEYSSTIVK